MPTIKELKEDLQFNTELIALLEVMKNTAVFQFRGLQASRKRFDKFSEAMAGFFRMIDTVVIPVPDVIPAKAGIQRGDNISALMRPSSTRKAMIMVTSGEGFIGDLNARVINRVASEERFADAELIIVGERGARFAQEMGRPFKLFPSAADSAGRRALAAQLRDYVIGGVKKGVFGRVAVSYPAPVSFMLQRVEVVELLPLGGAGEKGTAPFLPGNDSSKKGAVPFSQLIVESSIAGIIDYLAAESVKQRLTDILEDSKLSEFAARAIHLESSSQQLAEKRAKVRLQYFKAYHELIDKSTRELFSSQVIIHGRSQ